jgi:hemin uptake protein HemP
MSTLPQSGATELVSAQNVPELSVNEMARHLDAGHTRVIIEDRDLTAPPGSCSDGARYLVKATATGAWAGKDGKLAIAVGTDASNGWLYQTVAVEGFRLYIRDENVEIQHNGSSWITVATSGNPPESIIIACSDETSDISTGAAKATFRMPYAFTLSAVRASCGTAPTGSTIVIDINESGSTILSTKLSIDVSEKTSTTAVTPAVISDTALADDAEITIDFDQVGSTITGAGVKVTLIGSRT